MKPYQTKQNKNDENCVNLIAIWCSIWIEKWCFSLFFYINHFRKVFFLVWFACILGCFCYYYGLTKVDYHWIFDFFSLWSLYLIGTTLFNMMIVDEQSKSTKKRIVQFWHLFVTKINVFFSRCFFCYSIDIEFIPYLCSIWIFFPNAYVFEFAFTCMVKKFVVFFLDSNDHDDVK